MSRQHSISRRGVVEVGPSRAREENRAGDAQRLLDEEADETVGAGRYERTAAREAYRSGRCKRKLVTTSGEVALDVPQASRRHPSRPPS